MSGADDPRCAEYRNVPDPELVARRGRFVAEGRLVVTRLLAQARLTVVSAMVTEPALAALKDRFDARPDVPVYVVPQEVMNGITGFNIHRGCLAIGERPPLEPLDTVAANARRLLVLERVANADNVGSAFRNALALGAGAVLLGPSCADPLYRKAIRTSMGAALTLPFTNAEPWPDALLALRRDGWTLVAMTPDTSATPLREIARETAGSRVAILVGHEGEGLTPEALAACTHRARIPMAAGADSVNVATAAAIALYELNSNFELRTPNRRTSNLEPRTWNRTRTEKREPRSVNGSPHSIDVVALGENSVDHVYRIPTYPDPHAASAKQRITSHVVSPGGQVATALCACAAFGLRTRYLGVFGSDEGGALMRRVLEERGVDVRAAVTRDVPNRGAVILVAEHGGERVILWERDARLALDPSEVDPGVVRAARLLHVDAVDEAIATHVAAIAREAGLHVTCDVDTITDATASLLSFVTAPIFSEHALAALTGLADPERGLRALRRQHAGLLCVTLGARGAMVLEGERLHHTPGHRVDAVDTTGAGDVFRGAFIHALLRGDTPPAILRFANAAAALSCTHEGAIPSVPALADVERLADTKDTR